MKLAELFRAQPTALLFLEAMLMVVGIGVLDAVGGWDYSLFLFYAFPILLLAWFSERRLAIVCALACAAVWYAAKFDVHPYRSDHTYAWATLNRAAYFLFVAFGGAAMRAYREENRAKLEAMIRTHELEREIVRVSEFEQMRIGQELHDGLCQNLAAIDCAAACLKTDLESKALTEAQSVDVIQHLLRQALKETRDLARGIFPVQMDSEGLRAALVELVEITNRSPQVEVTLNEDEEVKIPDPKVAMHLYRITQQALNNALTHAGAKRIAVRLQGDDSGVVVSVTDDGCGFQPTETPSRGMGLRTMQYRSRLIGADLVVESNKGTGTVVRCVLPLSHAHSNRIQSREGDARRGSPDVP